VIRGGKGASSSYSANRRRMCVLKQPHPRGPGGIHVEGDSLSATGGVPQPFDEAIGKIGFELGKLAQCKFHFRVVFNHQFGIFEQSLQALD